MSPGRSDRAPTDYDRSIFLNCPFDDAYRPLFYAAIFTVLDCGYVPRCALEVYDSGQVRIEKIFRLIEACRHGIHDISRTEFDPKSKLPRFNMPLELGIFLGAQRFGVAMHRRKNCLIVDRERYRYQQFISDISGQDVEAHDGQEPRFISVTRDWLAALEIGDPLPGGTAIHRRFTAFQFELPAICATHRIRPDELTFRDYSNIALAWLRANQAVQ